MHVTRVDCGADHTAAIVTQRGDTGGGGGGELYTWGRGGSGRLGHGDELDVEVPKRVAAGVKPDHWSAAGQIPMPEGAKVCAVSCGFNHTVIGLAASGGGGGDDVGAGVDQLCAVGYGIYGQLGYGYRDNLENPVLLTLPLGNPPS